MLNEIYLQTFLNKNSIKRLKLNQYYLGSCESIIGYNFNCPRPKPDNNEIHENFSDLYLFLNEFSDLQ